MGNTIIHYFKRSVMTKKGRVDKMFARSITVKGKKYYRIVKSYRVNGKVKQAYVFACGPGEIGKENAELFLADDSDYKSNLLSLKDNPKVKRLVRSLIPSQGYENRRKGQSDNIWEGRAKKYHCLERDEDVTLRVLKDTGVTICLDAGPGHECKKCEWNS